MQQRSRLPLWSALVCASMMCGAATAQADRGKLLLTGGVSTIEGAAGGGLTPWAVIGSYATDGEVGGTGFVTAVNTQDYALRTYGVAVGIRDRVELSFAHQNFDTRDNLAPLGLPGLHLKQDIVGLKVRVAGDAVLDSDTWMPQVAVGLQHKRTDAGDLGADQELFTDRRVRGSRSHRPGCAATPANRWLPLRPVRVLTTLAQTFDLSPSRNTS